MVDTMVGNNASAVGAPIRDVVNPSLASDDGAVSFPAVSDYLSAPDSADLDLANGPFSLELWFRRDTDTGSPATLLTKGTNAYLVNINASDEFVLDKVGMTGYITRATAPVPANGTWHHYVITRSGSGAGNTLIYVDGVEGHLDSLPATVLADSSAPLEFGREGALNRIAGALDEPAIYKTVLTPSQVAAHYAARTGSGGGLGDANGASSDPVVSADGRYLAFRSDATNLVSADSNGLGDIFLRDRQTGITTRVSIATGGTQANGASGLPAISADGRYVAYQSDATNLVAADTNTATDIFLFDRVAATTSRVSVDAAGGQANGPSRDAALSADGSTLAFGSDATNLVAADSNARSDVFVRALASGAVVRASVSNSGGQADDASGRPALNADGTRVAFDSSAANLATGVGGYLYADHENAEGIHEPETDKPPSPSG